MTRGNRVGRFRELKNKLQLAISGLSAKSYFNLLIFRNLREVEMFGKTILPANPTNKSDSPSKWLKEIGEPYENKQAASIRVPMIVTSWKNHLQAPWVPGMLFTVR